MGKAVGTAAAGESRRPGWEDLKILEMGNKSSELSFRNISSKS